MIPAPGPKELEALIVQLLSPDNVTRGAAETTYNSWRGQSPDALLAAVMQVLMNSSYEEARSMCIVLLRSLIASTKESVWDKTAPATRQSVCSELLVAVVNESNPVLRHKLNLLVAEVGAKLVQQGQWPELLPFLQASFESQLEGKKETSLTIFGELASSLGQTFVPHYQTLRNNLHAGLSDPSLNVRIAALLATCNFLQGLFRPEHKEIFVPLGPLLLETIKAILTAKREAEAQSALKLLVQIADTEPTFLQPSVHAVVDTMLAIANSKDFEEDTQRLACEVLLTLTESKPAWMRKIPGCSQALIQIAFTLMLSLEDVPLAEWNQLEDDDDSDMVNYDYGEEYLNRLSLALGGRTLVPQVFPIVNKLLSDSDNWKHLYCAAMAISIIGEGSTKTLSPHLSDILNKIVPLANNSHPKVRWSACNCIGQMSTDFGPKLQKLFHPIVLPALAAVMDDVNNPRTRSHAAAALVNFVERCDEKILITYLEPLLGKLFSLLQTNSLFVQQHVSSHYQNERIKKRMEMRGNHVMFFEHGQAVLAVAAVADVAGEQFTKYHDIFIPTLLQIVVHCKTKEQRKLRGQAIECISMIGCAVGNEKFNGKEVMNILMQQQALAVDYDDPQRPFIEEAMVRLCKCLKKDFTPYLSTVLPPILDTAQKSDIIISESNPEGPPSQDGWEYVVLGEKCFGVRTASLEEKAYACEMLVAYAEELGGSFFPYVDPVLKIMLPLLKFYYTEEVRIAAAECMPALLTSALEHTQGAGAAAGADVMYVRNIFLYMFPTFIEAIQHELDTEVLNVMLASFVKCLDVVKEVFNAEQLTTVAKAVDGLFKDYIEFIESKQGDKEDADEEEEERISDEITSYEDVIANVADLVGRVVQHHGPQFLPIFHPVLQCVLDFIKPTARIAERHIAICIVDDIVDYGGKAATAVFPIVMPFYLDYEQFYPYVPEALSRLNAVCNLPEARIEEYLVATDNAVSAIGWICVTFGNQLDLGAILPVWLQYMPIREDSEEAVVVYNNLCDFIEKAGPQLMGPNYEHLPKLVALFVEILGTDFTDETLEKRIATIVKGISTLPPEITQKAWAALSVPAQEKLKSLMTQ